METKAEEESAELAAWQSSEWRSPPCIRSFRRKRIGRAIRGIQAVQEEESDVAIGTESKAEQETVEDQDYPPLAEGTKLYEARGLDAGPRIVQKLFGLGDNRTSNIVKRIAEEEIAHVAVGVSWFLTVCRKMGCMPDKTFTVLLEELDVELKGPFNYEARAEAGMPRDWYDTSNLGLSRWDNHLDVENDKERMILQDASTEQAHCNPHKFPVSDEGIKTTDFDLSKVCRTRSRACLGYDSRVCKEACVWKG